MLVPSAKTEPIPETYSAATTGCGSDDIDTKGIAIRIPKGIRRRNRIRPEGIRIVRVNLQERCAGVEAPAHFNRWRNAIAGRTTEVLAEIVLMRAAVEGGGSIEDLTY